MREIKFRAWDKKKKKKKKMREVTTLYLDKAANRQPGAGFSDLIYWNSLKDYELMQFTGLKDKHGKEIYEGDIVRRHWSGDKAEDQAVVFTDGAFIWGDGKGATGIDSSWATVIGNIYENPELIK